MPFNYKKLTISNSERFRVAMRKSTLTIVIKKIFTLKYFIIQNDFL